MMSCLHLGPVVEQELTKCLDGHVPHAWVGVAEESRCAGDDLVLKRHRELAAFADLDHLADGVHGRVGEHPARL